MSEIVEQIKSLPGPILVLGANGFIGSNLFRMLLEIRSDVFGTTSLHSNWRLADIPKQHLFQVNLSFLSQLKFLLDTVNPTTVFDCVAYGAYSFEKNVPRIYQTIFADKIPLLDELLARHVHCYIHAGSSSEYGQNARQPKEIEPTSPDSPYAVAKSATANLIYFSGKHRGLRCANLRFYSVYGPWEDSARLIPTFIANGLIGRYPAFVNADTARDFIYIDDVCQSFIHAATYLKPENYGESFNIGTGLKTTIRDLAAQGGELFEINEAPQFSTMEARSWDNSEWLADSSKAKNILQWEAQVSLSDGLSKTIAWYKNLEDKKSYAANSKQNAPKKHASVSAIVACYKDELAIPIMVERLTEVLERCASDYEIILVNDCSPDNTEAIIQELTSRHPKVLGISHSRNFGSQAAFRSGMEIASKNACVLLDGDLQDPPELIEQFIEQWQKGYDVVYGVRVKRKAPLLMQISYKLFYRVFAAFSSVHIPRDAGDFSLMDKRAVDCILKCGERDLFIRGLRAYVGFKQTGVAYERPERMFGVTTNNFLKNVSWAKKGIFSFSRTPLDILTTAGIVLTVLTVIMAAVQFTLRIAAPQSAPKGITTVILLMMFFGSFTILSISLLGEYIAKIFEEVKARPTYIRRHIIKNGLLMNSET
jgi:nucleoside-diphosphate-sugar epimerase/glycosyltransferase involved in cell wall biosynthesis